MLYSSVLYKMSIYIFHTHKSVVLSPYLRSFKTKYESSALVLQLALIKMQAWVSHIRSLGESSVHLNDESITYAVSIQRLCSNINGQVKFQTSYTDPAESSLLSILQW